MSSRHHIDDFMRGRIIGKIEEGRKITDVAREFDIAHSVVSRLWKSFKTTGMYSTVLPVCNGVVRHNWTEQDWACVLFSDESRFSLSSDCRRQLIWRESGTAYRPENIQEKDRYPTCSIMVWAGIMINGRTCLHVVAEWDYDGRTTTLMKFYFLMFIFSVVLSVINFFMDDNTTCHRTLTVQVCLDSEGIQRLVWQARSPDLNPIENVWDALGKQDAGQKLSSDEQEHPHPCTHRGTG
ncbi:transposable element Tcb2 transposase [Trichonephila clavipes]|nr:transposable element Tcb2 transposase [Trichonephila clavipes]